MTLSQVTQEAGVYSKIPLLWHIKQGYQELGERGNGELLLSEYTISAWDHEKVLEMESNDVYTTLRIYFMH